MKNLLLSALALVAASGTMGASFAATAEPAAPDGQPLGQFLLWADGNSYTTFGANQSVTIDLGAIAFACDFIFPTADIYIVPTGVTAGQSLVDVGGAANTVIGAGGGVFVSETIGFTAPTGAIGAGTYAVVFDECQDGVFTAGQDACFDPAFTVILPSVLPPIDPAIQAIKAQAAAQATFWAEAVQGYAVLFAVYDIISAVQAGLNPSDFVLWLTGVAISGATGVSIQTGVLDTLVDMTFHYAALAADPPDSDYERLTPLELSPLASAGSGEALALAVDELGNTAVEQEALSLALLHSIERYQGAALDGNAQWGLVHARAARDYARLLAENLQRSSDAQAVLGAEVSGDGDDFDAIGQTADGLRERVASEGFSPLEALLLEQLGQEGASIADLQDSFVNSSWLLQSPEVQAAVGVLEFDGDSEADLLARIAAGAALDADTIAALMSDATLLDGIVAQIEATNPPEPAPTADAGGPYVADEGVALLLDGSGSFDPDGVLIEYAWDLDRDGEFDDELGPSATVAHVFAADRGGLIGLRVTDDQGFQGIAYSEVVIHSVNSPPSILTHEPTGLFPDVALGGTLAFSVTAMDPDMDPLQYHWFVDDQLVSDQQAFVYAPVGALEIGPHSLRIQVSDGLPEGGEVNLRFAVGVSAAGLGTGSALAYCFGDGSGVTCPCGNFGAPGSGCQNSTGAGGLLSAAGHIGILDDGLSLTASQLVPNKYGLIFLGPEQVGAVFGDGLRCVEPGPPGAGYLRFPVQHSGALGSFTLGPGIVATSAGLFGAPGTILPGTSWNFQAFYRDPFGPCGSAFNLTNAVSVTFGE